ncbi:MAG: ATP-binding protein [Sphingobacteriaceae bacterium]
MEINTLNKNSKTLQHEISWLTEILDTRMKLYFDNDCKYKDISEVEPPSLPSDTSTYAQFIHQNKLNAEERIALLLSLIPHLKPQVLDVFFTRNSSYDRGFSEFGGIKGKTFNGFLPSGETLLFIIAGKNLKKRLQTEHFFLHTSFLFKNNIIKLQATENGEPIMSGMLNIATEHLSLFTSGFLGKPDYSPNFPAKRIETKLDWKDLVLEPHVKLEVEEIKTWIKWNSELKENDSVKSIIKPGYRSLFYGPPGTGKTLTVSLLGKVTNKDVYKIDLSMIVSKYIGETEKNLATVFDVAENKNWILFFDEADALFGKRTATSSSNDRYANQEVAYLLQRIEDFPGLIILATNLKINLDDAFARRFQSMIHFPMPGVKERIQLWENAFFNYGKIEEDLDFKKLAEKYVLSGGAIINVLMYCLLYKKNTGKQIDEHTILEGVKKELKKEGKTI